MNVAVGFEGLELVDEVGGIFGVGDGVRDDDVAVLAGDAVEFREGCLDIGEVMQGVAGDDAVEVGVIEGHLQAFVGDKVEIGDVVFAADFVILGNGLAGNIDAGDVVLGEAFGHFEGQVSAAGAEIEIAFFGLDIEQVDEGLQVGIVAVDFAVGFGVQFLIETGSCLVDDVG